MAEINPDVILLDVMMPGMDGPTTLLALRAATSTRPHIPVVFVTAKSQRFETDSLCRLGAAGVVVKPFDPLRHLAAEVLSCLAHRYRPLKILQHHRQRPQRPEEGQWK